MLVVKFDTRGALTIHWPERDADVITLGQAFTTYEASLPEDQRQPASLVSQIETLTAQGGEAATSAGAGEANRASASGGFDQTFEKAVPQGGLAIDRLKGKYAENLGQLELWGVPTKKAMNGRVSVSKPKSVSAWLKFFAAYVEQEGKQTAANQVADPALEDMKKTATDLQTQYQAREQSRSAREINVGARTAASQPLMDALQAAAVLLCVSRFGGKVVKDLQSWGFDVTAVSSTGTAASPASGSATASTGTAGTAATPAPASPPA